MWPKHVVSRIPQPFQIRTHDSLRKWGFINQEELFWLSISKKKCMHTTRSFVQSEGRVKENTYIDGCRCNERLKSKTEGTSHKHWVEWVKHVTQSIGRVYRRRHRTWSDGQETEAPEFMWEWVSFRGRVTNCWRFFFKTNTRYWKLSWQFHPLKQKQFLPWKQKRFTRKLENPS